MGIQHTGSKLAYFPITAIMVTVIMTPMDSQKSASNSSSKNNDNIAAREAASAKESFTAKLHRWFDIRQMNIAGRYTFLGIVIILYFPGHSHYFHRFAVFLPGASNRLCSATTRHNGAMGHWLRRCHIANLHLASTNEIGRQRRPTNKG